jgi:hypothetical protein
MANSLSMMPISGAFFVGLLLLGVAAYIYMAIALMTIAKKTNTPNAWLAWIPIANVYLVTQIGKQNGWWTAGLLVGIIPVIGSLALIGLIIFLWWKLAEVIGKPGWWGILVAIPIVNLIVIGMMAWGK